MVSKLIKYIWVLFGVQVALIFILIVFQVNQALTKRMAEFAGLYAAYAMIAHLILGAIRYFSSKKDK